MGDLSRLRAGRRMVGTRGGSPRRVLLPPVRDSVHRAFNNVLTPGVR